MPQVIRVVDRLQDQDDVDMSTVADGEVLRWDQTLGEWVGVEPVGDKYYEHVQDAPLSTWVVEHNLGKYPAVTVIDSAGSKYDPDVHYDSLNMLTISHSAPFSGKAACS